MAALARARGTPRRRHRTGRHGGWLARDGRCRLSEEAVWYLIRASGVVAIALLSLSVALGALSTVMRLPDRTAGLPRFAVQAVHRDVSLLALVLLAVHTVASVFHTFVDIRWVDAVVPFAGPYEPLWIGLGALALDLLVVAAVAAALRHRLGPRTWRVVHASAYAAWALAAVHAVGIGTDVDRTWAWGVAAACLLVVTSAVGRRLLAGRRAGAAAPVRPTGPRSASWSP